MKGIAWCSAQDAALRAGWANPRVTSEDIADVLMVPLLAVKSRACKLGLRKARAIPPRIIETTENEVRCWVPGSGGRIVVLDSADMQFFLNQPGGWYAHKEGENHYVFTRVCPRKKLHRLLLNAPDHLVVDHKNGDGLDNRRCNIRLATSRQNSWNSRRRYVRRTSLYKFVWLHESGRYTGTLFGPGGKRHSIGYYEDEREAARAADALARLFRGEFARLNLPNDLMSEAEILANPSLARCYTARPALVAEAA